MLIDKVIRESQSRYGAFCYNTAMLQFWRRTYWLSIAFHPRGMTSLYMYIIECRCPFLIFPNFLALQHTCQSCSLTDAQLLNTEQIQHKIQMLNAQYLIRLAFSLIFSLHTTSMYKGNSTKESSRYLAATWVLIPGTPLILIPFPSGISSCDVGLNRELKQQWWRQLQLWKHQLKSVFVLLQT